MDSSSALNPLAQASKNSIWPCTCDEIGGVTVVDVVSGVVGGVVKANTVLGVKVLAVTWG